MTTNSFSHIFLVPPISPYSPLGCVKNTIDTNNTFTHLLSLLIFKCVKSCLKPDSAFLFSCFTLTRVDTTAGSETFLSPNLCALNEAIFISDKRGANRGIKHDIITQHWCKCSQELFFSQVYLLTIMHCWCVEGTSSMAHSLDTPSQVASTWL